MDDQSLAALAQRLQAQRSAIKAAKLIAERTERLLSARMLAAKVVTVQIDDEWRAVRDEPVQRTVDRDKFLVACAECEIGSEEVKRCEKHTIDLRAAKRVLGDLVPFDSICELKTQGPRIRIVRGADDAADDPAD